MNLSQFSRYPLTFGVTPIEPLVNLSKHLGNKVEIWAKRDDCNSGLAFGGNKLRKLEYLIPEAITQGCDTLVSIGGIQSNHTRLVAATAAKIGMKCVLVQGSWVNWPDSNYDRVGNILLSRTLGAKVKFSQEDFNIASKSNLNAAAEEVRQQGGIPYIIPVGASDHRLGGLGYVNFAEEVRQQEKELGFRFDYIVTCTASGSTQAGMIVGFAADGRADRVIGIDVTATPTATKAQVKRIAQNTAKLVGLKRDISDTDIVLHECYAFPEYGIPSSETIEAIHLCARLEAMLTDPVYEGKSMQGLIDLIHKNYFPAGAKILYAHLGGVPAINAYSYLFKD